MNRKHGRFKRLFALFLVLVMLATSGNGYSMQAVAAGIDETVQTEQTDGAAPQNTQPQTSQTTAPQSSESQNTQPQTSQTTAPQSSEPQNTQPQTSQTTAPQSSEPQNTQPQTSQTTAPQSSEPQNTQPQTSQTTAPQSSEPENTQPQTSQTTAPQSGEPESTQPQTDQTAAPADNGQSGADNGANGISLMSTEPGSGINIDVTSRLLIDGNKSYVLAGEDFQLQIQYSVPKLGADQGTEYSGAYIQFSLPLYVKLKTTGVDSEGKPVYSIDGKEYSRIDDSQADKGIYYIHLAEGGTLETQQTNTLNIGLTTENLVTPDSRELNFNSFRFNVSYLTENNDKKNVELPVPGSATVVKASADWQIEKTITSSQDGHAYVRQDGSDCFEVTYRVTVSDKAGVNRLGRLGFESYSVTDTLPANLPSGGQAQEITDVKILHGGSGQDMALAEGEDYTIVQSDDGHPAGITFKTADTVRDGEAGQYQEAGDVTNTTYEYTVKYPYEPYTTESTEPEIMTYTLENTAELDYTLHGESAKQKTDTAAFDIAAYEDGVASADVTVKKQLSIGGETFILDSGYSDKYSGTVTFTLYKNEDCTEVAYNINRQPMQDIAVGADGTATFNDVRFGTYYIKETRTLPGFKAADKVKVVIDEKGSVYFSDSQTSADEPYIVNNEADTIGMLTFTKKGSDAYGNKDQELSGATFTLTAVDGGKAYTAASDGSGKVVFHNLPAGKYTLKETALTEELIEKGYTLSDKTFEVEIKGNEISRPDLDDDNVFNNESPKGLLKITKIDGQAKENRLSGAVFEVYGPYATEDEALKASGSPDTELKAATLTTGKNGEVTSGPLAKGFYVLVETSAPANYTAGEPAVVEVEAKKTVMITIENIPQARVTFSKAGAEKEGEPVSQELAGAVFEIYDANEHLLYGVKDADGNYTDVSTEPEGRTKVEITTQLDSTGKSTSPYVTLAPGTYYYKEIKAPAPYMPDSQLHSFTVAKVKTDESSEWNIAQTVTVYNYLSTGQIRIMKSTADGKATASAVNGAVFGVYGSEEDAAEDVNRIDTITTDTYVVNETPTNGVGYSTAALKLGTIYYVREISAPAGYAINTEVFEVQCTADNKIQEIECVNQPTVSIKIIKTDSVTKEALNGVTFELWNAKEEDGGKKLAEGQTKDGGVLTFGDLSPATTYYIKETKTVDGYVLDGQWHEVKTKAYDSSSSDLTEEVAITNVPKGNLIVEKWDTFNADMEDDYKQMSGVEFELYSVGDDNAADFGADQSKTKIGEKKTGKDGRVTWDNLEPGDYWLVEHYPEGYEEIDNSGKITAETEVTRVTVAAGQNKGSDYSAKIEKIENSATYGKLTLGKYGATANGSADMNKPLSDVEFTVYTDAECEEAKATLTTGADGAVTSGWLVPGTYYIKETRADGYVLLEDVYKVTVAANEVTDTAVVVGSDPETEINLTELVNEKKGGFTIKKYGLYLPSSDSSSQEEILEQLSGAEFTLYVYDEADGALGDNGLPKGSAALPEDVSGREVVKTFKMENYTQTISGIAPGLYWLRETKTPDDTWDRVDDMLICILPDGTTKYGTVKEEGVTWSGAAVTPAIELKDDSNKPRIRFIKKVYGEETRIDGAEFELYVADEKGTPTEVSINGEKETVNLTKVGGSIDSGTARDPETGEAISGEAITPKLEPGKTYYLKEVSLKGDLNNYYFYFDEENCWTKIEIPANAKGEEYTTTIYNYRKVLYPGQKYDAEKNTPLSGAVLALFDNKADAQAMVQRLKTEYNEAVENKRLKQSDVVNADGTLTKLAEEWNIEQISVSDGSGKFEFSNLFPEKTYYIVEIVAPNKYQLEKDENGDYVVHTVVPNVGDAIKNEGPFASVDGNTSVHYLSIGDYDYNAIWLDKISVLSGQEYKITGAEFTIYGAKIVNDEAVPDTDNVIGTMNESSTTGLYMSNYLPNGTYFIAETKYPEGFEEAERGALSEEAQEIFGSGYDYIEVDGVRYYKVELGRTSDNTWFKDHPVYNKAQNGRFVLTKRSSTDETQKISATFTIEKYNDTAKVFETYAAYPSITTETYSEYVTSNFLEPGIYRLTETQVSGDYTMFTEPVYIEIKAGKVTDASGETSTEQITIDGKTTDISVYTPSEEDIEIIKPITVTNVPKGKFWVHKTGTWNSESQGNLEGVTFEVYKK